MSGRWIVNTDAAPGALPQSARVVRKYDRTRGNVAQGVVRCAMPLAEFGAPCAYCLGKGLYPFDRILRLGIYQDPLKHVIHQMKYRQRWALAEFLADRLLEQEPVKGLLSQTDCLVPVPLFAMRQIARGYNQADVIARR